MIESFAQIQDLYGISELLGQLTKLVYGGIPKKWVDPEMKEVIKNWPATFIENPTYYLDCLADSCRKSILTSLNPYVTRAEREGSHLVLREITTQGPELREPIQIQNGPLQLQIPPLADHKTSRASVIALLAGLSEHLRNAARFLLSYKKRVAELAGQLHIDFQILTYPVPQGKAIDEKSNGVEVIIWNPITPDGISGSPTIKTMMDLYPYICTRLKLSEGGSDINSKGFVEIFSATEIEDYAFATAPDYRKYSCSRIIFRPERLWFNWREDYNWNT
jgi:hypothetical protein